MLSSFRFGNAGRGSLPECCDVIGEVRVDAGLCNPVAEGTGILPYKLVDVPLNVDFIIPGCDDSIPVVAYLGCITPLDSLSVNF